MKSTAPAATPVAMPATFAFLSCAPPEDAAAVALGVDVLVAEFEWLVRVVKVDVGCDDDVDVRVDRCDSDMSGVGRIGVGVVRAVVVSDVVPSRSLVRLCKAD